eukprot:COSAG06_NODE_337_length_17232_cov_50.946797_5_plen_149_part_00
MCDYFYDPTDADAKFTLYFDQDAKQELSDKAAKVIAHLESLDIEALKQESTQFFKWIVMHHLSLEHKHYSQLLLDYFHSKGLLEMKTTVDNPVKQLKTRYCVMYTMGGQTFTRTYNSIREIKADTGKKPSQIKRQKMKDVVCTPAPVP